MQSEVVNPDDLEEDDQEDYSVLPDITDKGLKLGVRDDTIDKTDNENQSSSPKRVRFSDGTSPGDGG